MRPSRSQAYRRYLRLISFILGALLLWTIFKPPGGHWHAEARMASLDCTSPATCRYPPHREYDQSIAAGIKYHFTTSALGFRGKDVAPGKAAPPAIRVQMYGDSMVFGVGVNDGDTLPDSVRARLEHDFPGRKVEVMNFGLTSNYLYSNLRTYQAFGRAYEPDAVVFCSPREFTRDMNWRIRQIQGSEFLSSLVKTPLGAWFVNYYQWKVMEWEWAPSGTAALKELMMTLLADQRDRGLKVYFLEFFHEGSVKWIHKEHMDAVLDNAIPDGLQYHAVRSPLTLHEYEVSPYAIPNDGHPTPTGHRYFAGLVADAIASDLQKDRSESPPPAAPPPTAAPPPAAPPPHP